MASRKEQVIIYSMVGVIAFSAFAIALPFIFLGGDNDDSAANPNNPNNPGENLCLPVLADPTAKPLPTPKVETFKDDITELESRDIKVGEGQEAQSGDCVEAHYHGWVAKTGTVFDSSYQAGSPAKFDLDNLIEGWKEGIPGMKVGGQRMLIIPSEKAYGEAGSPPVIEPNTDLVFVIELVDIES